MSTTLRLTIAEYDRMIESGVFGEDRRVELIEGELREMPALGPSHESVVDLFARWSFTNTVANEVRIRVQNSVGLPELESVPEPDLAWVREKSYWSGRPQPPDVLLLVEVADSSLHYDRTTKAPLYAVAGIADYWIVNIPMKCIEVFRDPSEGEYHETRSYGLSESVSPVAYPDLSLQVATLFGA